MHKAASYKSHSLYQLINDATDNFLQSEDDLLNKRICSEILRTSDGPKVAAKVINKILNKSLSSHFHQSIWYCLLLLDVATKNTDSRFCAAVLSKDVFGDLIKIMEPKYQVPDFVQEKFLYIIKEWHKSLISVTGYYNLDKFYRQQMSPAVVPIDSSKRLYPVQLSSLPYGQPHVQQSMMDKDKIIKDIDVIETNISIFSDTLRTVNPSQMTVEENQFLKELHDSVKSMQSRINDILPVLEWEDVTNQLLQVNDKINSTSERYIRLMTCKTQQLLVSSHIAIAEGGGDAAPTDEYYDQPSALGINSRPAQEVNDVYDIPSLPSYSEASANLSKINSNQSSREMNLINFDEETPPKFNTKQALPPIPRSSANDLLTGPDPPPPSSSQNRMSSDEFDDFIESIARRHQSPGSGIPEEEYAPPLYDEARVTKPSHS